MTNITVDIYAQDCHLQLNLPDFFEKSTLVKIRKAFDLMTVEPWRNEAARDKLQSFFLSWQESLETGLEYSRAAEKAAAGRVRDTKRQIACFGTMATKEMKNRLTMEQNKLKSATRSVKRLTAELARCGKIINYYNQI